MVYKKIKRTKIIKKQPKRISESKLKGTKKKKKSKKGLLIHKKNNRNNSQKLSPYSKIKTYNLQGGKEKSVCKDVVNLKKFEKFIKKTNKEIEAVKKSSEYFKKNLNTNEPQELLAQYFNLAKIHFILKIRKSFYEQNLSEFIGTKIRTDTFNTPFNENDFVYNISDKKSQFDSINVILGQIGVKLTDTQMRRETLLLENKIFINNYALTDKKRKKKLLKHYDNLYTFFTNKKGKFFSQIKNTFRKNKKYNFDYTKQNIHTEINSIYLEKLKDKNRLKSSFKSKLIPERIAQYKAVLGNDGEIEFKLTVKDIKKKKKELQYTGKDGGKNLGKQLYKRDLLFAKCHTIFSSKIKKYNLLMNSINKLIEEDNNLQKQVGHMSSHIEDITVKLHKKLDIKLKDLFKTDSNEQFKKFNFAIFHLAPVKVDSSENNEYKQKCSNYDFSQLTKIKKTLDDIFTIVDTMNIPPNKPLITPILKFVKDRFIGINQIFEAIKKDTKQLRDNFLYIGKQKNEIRSTIYLLKIINNIRKAFSKGIHDLSLLSSYLETFLNEDYRNKMIKLTSNVKPIIHQLYKNSITNRRGGAIYNDNNGLVINKNVTSIQKNDPHISFIYSHLNKVNEIENKFYKNFKYEKSIDGLKFPFKKPRYHSSTKEKNYFNIVFLSKQFISKYTENTTYDVDLNDKDFLDKIDFNDTFGKCIQSKISETETLNTYFNKINNTGNCFKPFINLKKNIQTYFRLIEVSSKTNRDKEQQIQTEAILLVVSIYMKIFLFNFNNKHITSKNIDINAYELEGEIDSFFNYIIYFVSFMKSHVNYNESWKPNVEQNLNNTCINDTLNKNFTHLKM